MGVNFVSIALWRDVVGLDTVGTNNPKMVADLHRGLYRNCCLRRDTKRPLLASNDDTRDTCV
jgi:hypothetical protein